ncbi:MAG: phosphate/phosphite/phosphonate ABC transporter substrate-binding protein [Desulfobacterium sp.]
MGNFIYFLLIFWVTATYLFFPIVGHADEKTYSFGVVPQFEARRIQKIWQPILTRLSKETGLKLHLFNSPEIPAFEKSFSEGEFDFAYMNPYHLVVANQTQGYTPIVKDNGRQLYGIIVVRKDSPIVDLQGLNGKTIAFPAPNSLGAALIPRAEFTRKFKIDFTPKYVKSHTSVYLNVILRQVDAGGGVQRTFSRQKEAVQQPLRILHETRRVNSHPVAVHPRVSAEVAELIRTAFLTMGETEKGRDMLKKIPIDKVGPASLVDYDPLKSMGLEDFYVKESLK